MKKSSVSSTPPLWPEVPRVLAFRTSERKLILDIPAHSDALLLTAIGYAIHHEMRYAGLWAANNDEARREGGPILKEFLRERTVSASRLLALYTALRYLVSHPRESDLAPEAMKDAATRSYHDGYREAQDKRCSEKPLAA